MSINWITPSRGRPLGGSKKPYYCYVSATTNHKKPSVIITLSADMMKDARIVCGDRINVGYNEHCLFLKRALTGGFSLGAAGKGGAEREKSIGTFTRSNIKICGDFFTGSRYFSKDQILINDDGVICIPKADSHDATI